MAQLNVAIGKTGNTLEAQDTLETPRTTTTIPKAMLAHTSITTGRITARQDSADSK